MAASDYFAAHVRRAVSFACAIAACSAYTSKPVHLLEPPTSNADTEPVVNDVVPDIGFDETIKKNMCAQKQMTVADIRVDHTCGKTYNATNTFIKWSLGACRNDDVCGDAEIKFMRKTDRSLGCKITAENAPKCEFATNEGSLEQDGFEAPDLKNTACAHSDKLHCIPSPCSILTMSYFRDPMAESTPTGSVYNHSCCVGARQSDEPECITVDCSDRVFIGTEYVNHRSIPVPTGDAAEIVGHSTCDAQFGTEVFRYTDNTDKFKVTKRTEKEALKSMARPAREKCGTDECFENWPNKLILPSVLQHRRRPYELPPNPQYMYKGSNPGDNQLEREMFEKFMNGTSLLPPDPADYQCHDKKPPPTIWIVPCCGGTRCQQKEKERLLQQHGINLDKHKCKDPTSTQPFELVVLGETNANAKKLWTLELLQERFIAASYVRSYLIFDFLKGSETAFLKTKLDDVLQANKFIGKFTNLINDHLGYTFESLLATTQAKKGKAHPMHTTCMSSSQINRYDTTKQTGFDDKQHVIQLASCEHDDQGNARHSFGAISATYQSDSTAITAIPQMAFIGDEGKGRGDLSVPGAFGKYGQLLGIVPTPTLLTYVIDEEKLPETADKPQCTEKDADNEFHEFCVEQKLYKLITKHYFGASSTVVDTSFESIARIAKLLRTLQPNEIASNHKGYNTDTCHLFSSFAHNGGGCNWLPQHELPGICPDQRAKRQKDVILPAHQSYLTNAGHRFGFLQFDQYRCSNYRMTPHYAHFEDRANSESEFPTLQHPGPLDCMRARTNAAMDNIKYHPHIVMPDWQSNTDNSQSTQTVEELINSADFQSKSEDDKLAALGASHNKDKFEDVCADAADPDAQYAAGATDAVYTCSKDSGGGGGYSDMLAEREGYEKVLDKENIMGNYMFRFSPGYDACVHQNNCLTENTDDEKVINFMRSHFTNNVGTALALDVKLDTDENTVGEAEEHLSGNTFFDTYVYPMPFSRPPAPYNNDFSKGANPAIDDRCNKQNSKDGKSNCFPPTLRDYEDNYCNNKETVLQEGKSCTLKGFLAIWNVFQAVQVFRQSWAKTEGDIQGVGANDEFLQKNIFRANQKFVNELWIRKYEGLPEHPHGDFFGSKYAHCYKKTAVDWGHWPDRFAFDLANEWEAYGGYDPRPRNSHFMFAAGENTADEHTSFHVGDTKLAQDTFLHGSNVDETDSKYNTDRKGIKNQALFQNAVRGDNNDVVSFHSCDKLFVYLCGQIDAYAAAGKRTDLTRNACKQYEMYKPILYDDGRQFMWIEAISKNPLKLPESVLLDKNVEGSVEYPSAEYTSMFDNQQPHHVYENVVKGQYPMVPRFPDNPHLTSRSKWNPFVCKEISVPSMFKAPGRTDFCNHEGLFRENFDARQLQTMFSSQTEKDGVSENKKNGYISAPWLFQKQLVVNKNTKKGYLFQTPMTAFGRDALTHVTRHAPFMFCPKSSCSNSSYAPRFLAHIDPRHLSNTLFHYTAYPWGNIDMSKFPAAKTMLESACQCCGRGDEYLLASTTKSALQCYRGTNTQPDQYLNFFAEPGGPLTERCFCQSNVNVFHKGTGTSNDDLAVAADYFKTKIAAKDGRLNEMRYHATTVKDKTKEKLDDHVVCKATDWMGICDSVYDNLDQDYSKDYDIDGNVLVASNRVWKRKEAVRKGMAYMVEPDGKPGLVFSDLSYDDTGETSAQYEQQMDKKGVKYNHDFTLAIKTGAIHWHYNYSALSVMQIWPLHGDTQMKSCLQMSGAQPCPNMYGYPRGFPSAYQMPDNTETVTHKMQPHTTCTNSTMNDPACFALGKTVADDLNPLPAAFFFGAYGATKFRLNTRQVWVSDTSKIGKELYPDAAGTAGGNDYNSHNFFNKRYRHNPIAMLRPNSKYAHLDITSNYHSWQTCESKVVKSKQECFKHMRFKGTADNIWSLTLDKLDLDFVSTTATHGSHVTKKFQLVVPYDGDAFSRNQPFTSALKAGEACDCKNLKPLYKCHLVTLANAIKDSEYQMVAQLLKKAYNLDQADDLLQNEIDALSVETCHYEWDRASKTAGLTIGGAIEPFYIAHEHLFRGDQVTSAQLDRIFDAHLPTNKTDGAIAEDSKKKKQQATGDMLDALRFKGMRSSQNYIDDVPWKFSGSCLRWPYGQAHYLSFRENDLDTIVKGSFKKKEHDGFVRDFGSTQQIGYCEKIRASPTGNGLSSNSKLAYCKNDAMTAEERSNWCNSHPLADESFTSLSISNPKASDMCNDHVCFFVPGHRTVPTLKSFLSTSGIDFTNKVVLVAPFTVKSIGFGFYSSLYVTGDGDATAVDANTIAAMGIQNPELFQYATNVREGVTESDIMEAASVFMSALCRLAPGSTEKRCRRISQPDMVADYKQTRGSQQTVNSGEFTLSIDEVNKPMQDFEIKLTHTNMSIYSAVPEYPMRFGNHRSHHTMTRFIVSAPEIVIGSIVADQTGCSSGYRCAAVLLIGPNATFTYAGLVHHGTGIQTIGTAVPVMALGRTHHGMGIVDVSHSGVKVSNDNDEIEHVIAAAAAVGTMYLSCSTPTATSCSAIAQFEPPPAKLVISGYNQKSVPLYNMSEAIGMFGMPVLKRLETRPIDHGAITYVGFMVLVLVAVLCVLFHVALFVEAKQIAVWLVQKRATIIQCQGDRWSCVFSPAKNQHVIQFNDKSRETSASLAIARVVCGVDGGCNQYNKYPDLIRYCWHCFTNN